MAEQSELLALQAGAVAGRQDSDDPILERPNPDVNALLALKAGPAAKRQDFNDPILERPNPDVNALLALQAGPTAERQDSDDPILECPNSDDPILEHPTSEDPILARPNSEDAISEDPILERPSSEDPILERPSSEDLILERPDSDDPILERPNSEDPILERPNSDDPILERPTSDDPILEFPSFDDPNSDDPISERPTSDDPTSERPTSDDPILEVLSSFQASVCPSMSASLIQQLQGDTPTPCLLQLARFFRAQSDLLRKQAKVLDELATQEESKASEDVDDMLHRTRVTCRVKRAHALMLESHDKIDSIEDSVYPWAEVRKDFVNRPMAGPYSLFVKANYEACAAKAPHLKCTDVSKELGAIWRSLSKDEKQPYFDEAAAALKRKSLEEAEEANKRAKLSEKVNDDATDS